MADPDADRPWPAPTEAALPESVGRLRFKLFRLGRKLDKALLAVGELEQELVRFRGPTRPDAPYGLTPEGRPKTKRDLRREARLPEVR